MTTLPIYENLIKECNHEDLSIEEKNEFMAIVKNIDENGSELMYAIIRMYQLENNDDKSTFKIPYGGKFIKNDIKFDLLDLPHQLKQILYKFLLIHSKSLNLDGKNNSLHGGVCEEKTNEGGRELGEEHEE